MNIDTSLWRAVDKGKMKVEEMPSRTAKMAKYSRDRELNFPLRWKLGQRLRELFVISSNEEGNDSIPGQDESFVPGQLSDYDINVAQEALRKAQE